MREIKFRAWDKVENKMRPAFTFSDIGDAGVDGWDEHNAVLSDKFYDFMQYTGLHDKNGVEIYEGDIVMKNYHYGLSAVWEISWDVDVSCFRAYPVGQKKIWEFSVDVSGSGSEIVIGNIYENPELTKG